MLYPSRFLHKFSHQLTITAERLTDDFVNALKNHPEITHLNFTGPLSIYKLVIIQVALEKNFAVTSVTFATTNIDRIDRMFAYGNDSLSIGKILQRNKCIAEQIIQPLQTDAQKIQLSFDDILNENHPLAMQALEYAAKYVDINKIVIKADDTKIPRLQSSLSSIQQLASIPIESSRPSKLSQTSNSYLTSGDDSEEYTEVISSPTNCLSSPRQPLF